MYRLIFNISCNTILPIFKNGTFYLDLGSLDCMKANIFKRIDHLALPVADLSKSVYFYTSNFEFTKYFDNTTPNGIKISYMMLGDTILELAQEPAGGFQGFHFCIQTTDFDGAIKKLLSNGVEILNAPHYTNPRQPEEKDWRRAVFAGPDGEQIEIRG